MKNAVLSIVFLMVNSFYHNFDRPFEEPKQNSQQLNWGAVIETQKNGFSLHYPSRTYIEQTAQPALIYLYNDGNFAYYVERRKNGNTIYEINLDDLSVKSILENDINIDGKILGIDLVIEIGNKRFALLSPNTFEYEPLLRKKFFYIAEINKGQIGELKRVDITTCSVAVSPLAQVLIRQLAEVTWAILNPNTIPKTLCLSSL